MSFKPKLPAFFSRTTDAAGETLLARPVVDSDAPARRGRIPFAADLLDRYPVGQQLQMLGGALVLVRRTRTA